MPGTRSRCERSTDTQALKNFLVVKVLNESLKKLEELQMREKQMRQEEEQFKREQEIRDRTREEVQRRLNEMRAWSTTDQGRAPMRSAPPDSSNAQVDAALVPVPKKKPPVPEDFNALPGAAARCCAAAAARAVRRKSQPQSLFNVQAAPIPLTPQVRTELPFGKR